MAEWLKAAASKAVVPGSRYRGFESHSLRHHQRALSTVHLSKIKLAKHKKPTVLRGGFSISNTNNRESTGKHLNLRENVARRKTLMRDLLNRAAMTRANSPHISIFRSIPPFQKPTTETNSKPRVLILPFYNKHKRRLSKTTHHFLVYNIQRRFVDKADIQPFLTQPFNGIQRTVQHLTVRNHVTGFTLANDLILPRTKVYPSPKNFDPSDFRM